MDHADRAAEAPTCTLCPRPRDARRPGPYCPTCAELLEETERDTARRQAIATLFGPPATPARFS